MITAVIPVKKNSTRCTNKNIRQFSDSNLLKKKLKLLQKVKNIDKILVSSDCDDMLKLAKEFNVDTHKRTDEMCSSTVSGADLYLSLANVIDTEHMLLTFCVTPFVKIETYENIIEIYKKNLESKEYDSVSTSLNFKHYIWYKNKPINYKYDEAPPTQCLPDYLLPTFGINIITKNFVLDNKNVIGKNPYFYNVDQIEAIDIDTPYDFLLSELLYTNNIVNCNIATNILKFRDRSDLELIDCSLGNTSNKQQILDCYDAIVKSKYDYIEINNLIQYELLKNKNVCKMVLNFDNIDFKYNNYVKVSFDNFKKLKHNCNKYLLSVNYNDNINELKNYIDKFTIKSIILDDNGIFNDNNFLPFLHKLYSIILNRDIIVGINSNSINIVNLAIFNGCTLVTSSIGGKGKYNGSLKSEELLVKLSLNKKYNITDSIHILKYYEKYIQSRINYIEKHSDYHPYYNFSQLTYLSFKDINNIIKLKKSMDYDYKYLFPNFVHL
jgi:CMP-N,N'-diacetyllegionaminic acid synthase